MFSQKHNKRNFKIHYTWIYLTELCNLHCEYCFYRHREQGREVLSEAIEKLFLLFEKEKTTPSTLIFSGGEAFLVKDKMFKIMAEVYQRFKSIPLHIQTNGLLIDKRDIETLLAFKVSLEFGIDGAFNQTARHRWGLKKELFKKLTENIQMCLKAGISCGCTMTVHPHEVQYMAEGLRFIQSLGLTQVDITPAAFEPWTPETVSNFKKQYLNLIRSSQFRKLFYIHEDVELMKPGMMDLSLHPPGYLLGGDPFLCLPEEKRKEFDLWDLKTGEFRPEIYAYYQKALMRMYNETSHILYRNQVCHSFELMNTMMGQEYMNTWAINDILRFQSKTHQALRSRKLLKKSVG